MGCAGARAGKRVRFQQVQGTGRCCGREGHGPGAGAGRQPVPGREGLAQPEEEFDLYPEGNGRL